MIDALFKVYVEPQSKMCVCTKRKRSSHTTKVGDEYRARKIERTELNGLGRPPL